MAGSGAGRAPSAAGRRDPRFDLLRGTLVLLMIFGHLGWRQLETHFQLGFVTVAEGFFLISGATLGMVERKRWNRQQSAELSATPADGEFRKLLRRGAWLYLANLVGVAIARALEGTRPFPGNYFDRYWGATPELERWLSFDQPSVLNVLPRYAAFLLLAPLAVMLLRRGRGALLLALSVGAWLLGWWTQDLLLPLFETARAPYPVVAWQMIFFGGMVVGWQATPRSQEQAAPAWQPAVVGLALVALAGFVLVEANKEWFDPAALSLWTARSWLGPLRVLNLIAVAVVVWEAASRWAPWVVRWCGRLVVPYGRSALQAFLLHSPLVWLLLAVPLLDTAEGLRKLIAVSVILGMLPLLNVGWVQRWLRP